MADYIKQDYVSEASEPPDRQADYDTHSRLDRESILSERKEYDPVIVLGIYNFQMAGGILLCQDSVSEQAWDGVAV